MNPITRRDLLKFGLGAAALSSVPVSLLRAAAASAPAGSAAPAVPAASTLPLITKPIPVSGERLPVIGIGTRTYNGVTEGIRTVIKGLADSGCTMIDTADNYAGGASESVIGDIVAEANIRAKLFVATKVNSGNRGKAAGRANIDASFQKLKTDRIDLFYIHNLVDVPAQLENLRELKAAGKIRYVGVTTSSDNQYAALEQLMQTQQLDFVQLDYSIDNRGVEARLLPLAVEKKIAIVTNLPLGRNALLPRVAGRPLPDWFAEFDCKSWPQFLLKYVVSHPAVNVAIPGTTRPEHLVDNVQAARGRLPDAAMRKRMEDFWATIPAA